MSYREWIQNEYQLWVEALQSSTTDNFKEHPIVKRMLSIGMGFPIPVAMTPLEEEVITAIDRIGYTEYPGLGGDCLRMVYYARKVLERLPPSIIEIGGGVGQFYAILRALGYTGDYFIQDLPEVALFQNAYLRAVHYETGLYTGQSLHFDFCVSLYALGEFNDELKAWCIETIVDKCPHGFILWNPHSGASKEVPFECKITDEYPMFHEDCKQLEW